MGVTKEELYEAVMAAASDQASSIKGDCNQCDRTNESCPTRIAITYIGLGRKAVANRKYYLKK